MDHSPRCHAKALVAHLRRKVQQFVEEGEWHRAAATSAVDAAKRLQQNLAAQVRNPSSGHSTPVSARLSIISRHVASLIMLLV